MPQRKPGESIEQFAIRTVWETGHFWSPENPDGWNVRSGDLSRLTARDSAVIAAFRSYAKSDATRYTQQVLEAHGRTPWFDGELGPALQAMVTHPEGRCPVPDHAPPPGVTFSFSDPRLQAVVERMQQDAVLPALGIGNWKSCHNVGDFHCAVVRWDQTRMPSHIGPVFTQVLTRVQRAYADVGLLFRFVDDGMIDLLTGDDLDGLTVNIDASFVNSSDGWIGLAIVGRNERCQDNIWCRFLASYRGGQSDAAIITQWTTLLKHELGHNCGRSHTNGGVMNPSIVNGLPAEWTVNDPSTNWLRDQFGGKAVPIPGGTPGPQPGPSPPITLQQQIDQLRIRDVVHDVTLNWLVRQVTNLKAGGPA